MRTEREINKIIERLSGCRDFIRLLKLSGFYEILDKNEDFTIFAPIDGAFKQLPARMVERLLKPENLPALRSLIGLHIIKGKFLWNELAKKISTPNIVNVRLTFKSDRNELYVNNAQVIEGNKLAGNGVIHLIDRVLLPPLN